MKYTVKLDNIEIGKSKLEFADPPMGIVFGKLFLKVESGFDLFKNHCVKNNIQFTEYPDDKLITTFNIPGLKAYRENGNEIVGEISISGIDSDFEITIMGIAYPYYEEEFPEHVKRYNEMF